MEIEVGEYVRTKNGLIFKVDEEKKNIDINEFLNIGGNRDIAKHSKNIIDLIEVGDYVNGYEIVPLYYDEDENIDILGVEVIDYGCGYIEELANINIRTILTHEMYEKNCYKLKE